MGWEALQALNPTPPLSPISFSRALHQLWSHFSRISGLQKKQLGKCCTTSTCCLLTFIKIPMGLSPDEFLERYQDTCKTDGCTSWAFLMGPGANREHGDNAFLSLSITALSTICNYLFISVFVYILSPVLDWKFLEGKNSVVFTSVFPST